MGRSAAAQGISPSHRKSPGGRSAAAASSSLSAFPDPPLHPRNSRERLLTSTTDFPVTPRQRSTTKASSRATGNTTSSSTQQIFNYFSSHPTFLFFVILGIFFFSGALLSSLRSWRGPAISSTASSDSPIALSHLHAGLVALENELKLKSKRQDAQSQEVVGLKHEIERLKQLKDQYHSLEDTMKSVEVALERIKHEFGAQLKEGFANFAKSNAATKNKQSGGLSDTDAQKLNQLYRMLYFDHVGKIDWARAAVGGSIDERFTSEGVNKDLRNTILASVIPYLPSKYHHRSRPFSKPADIIIGGPEAAKLGFVQTDRLQPGYCYAFSGSTGNVTINLPGVIEVSEIQIDHVSPEMSPMVDSAPKTIAVYVDDCLQSKQSTTVNEQNSDEAKEAEMSDKDESSKIEGGEPASQDSSSMGVKREACWGRPTFSQSPSVFVGRYEFDYPNSLSRTFKIDTSEQMATRRVRFEILENHGSQQCTCIYRLRIHGNHLEPLEKNARKEARVGGAAASYNEEVNLEL